MSSDSAVRSPFAEDDELTTSTSSWGRNDDEQRREGVDYAAALSQVLSSTSKAGGGEEEEEEDEFGDFVYTGKDVERPESEHEDAEDEDEHEVGGGGTYKERMKQVVGSDEEEDGLDRPGSLPTTPIKNKSTRLDERSIVETASPASPAASGMTVTSNETFPGFVMSTRARPSQQQQQPHQHLPSFSAHGSPSFPRRPASFHPQISRLRSTSYQQRFVSGSTSFSIAAPFDGSTPPRFDSPGTSAFDLASRRSSTSNLFAETHQAGVAITPSDLETLSPANTSEAGGRTVSDESVKWTTLKRISNRVYPPSSTKGNGAAGRVGLTSAGAAAMGLMGHPTTMGVSGIVAIGTSKGWVMIFDFAQNLRCICGTEAISKEAGPITAVAISQDHTFVAAGHATGWIHLYSLLQPTKPARSVSPTTLQPVLTGRKEGHLVGSKILHLGFVGARHTAIVSSDETGLAFYHSLGKVLMLASTDIIRMLGRYPEPPGVAAPLGKGSKKPSTILDMAPLPLGPAQHASDGQSLVAMLTPTKLVVVGLKPSPRTWWRATPSKSDDETAGLEYASSGVLGWWPSVGKEDNGTTIPNGSALPAIQGEDPVLAFAWGRKVRFVRVQKEVQNHKEETVVTGIQFVESEGWTCDGPILGLKWYSQRIVFVITPHHINVYDMATGQRLARDAHEIRNLVSHDYYVSAFPAPSSSTSYRSYTGSLSAHKKKIFALTTSDVRVGAILSWADRILALMQPGSILEAIELTTSYALGQSDASTIALPDDPIARREIVEPKLREILAASLEFVFAEDRLRDGSHADGATMQRMFEGLVGTCVRACLATGDVDWLFDDLYERYEQNGIEAIFLERIEPFVLSGSVHALPPSVSQRLIAIHEERGQYDAAQRIIWHVDPEAIDINQALRLCQRHKLYDALIYVYTRAMHDSVAPLVELLALVRNILQHRKERPRRIGVSESLDGDDDDEHGGDFKSPWLEDDVEATVPDAYKIFGFISQALTGLSYPSKDPLPYEEGNKARDAVYSFLLSGQTLSWPERGGKPVLTTDDEGTAEPTYPYLRMLLRFDAEALLDAFDLAFEESYLDDDAPGKKITRQLIVDRLLEVMATPARADEDDFTAIDRTFLNIFVARNLPKYPQYIHLKPSVLHRVLVELVTDADQSTTEDRQLAAEYLLSSYTPPDLDEMITLFEQAGFFRILRSIYRSDRRWAALASTYVRDPDIGADVFMHLRATLKLASKTTDARQVDELAETILDAVPTLIQAEEDGLHQLADLIDDFLPDYHPAVIDRLASTQWRQFAYLRCLLEPAHAVGESGTTSKERTPSARLSTPLRLQYLALLCAHEPRHVIRYLESDSHRLIGADDVLKICERAEAYDALVWVIDRRGQTKVALEKADEALETRTDQLVQAMLHGQPNEAERVEEEGDEDEEGGDERPRALPAVSKSDALIDQIAAIATVAVSICVKRATGPERTQEMTGEDLWFHLLGSLVSTVRAIRAIAPAPARPSDRSSSHRRTSGASIILNDEEPEPLSARAQDVLSSLIPTALSSLVSTTSTRDVSFPTLMRRLIDSNARSPGGNRSYREFKAIVTSMLDTYVSEGEFLQLTSSIASQDLFEHVEKLRFERSKGWRARGQLCDECLQSVWGPAGLGTSPPMSRSASVSLVVDSLGLTGRPKMKQRPSIKGKEVDWPAPAESQLRHGAAEGRLEPLNGIVVGRDGRLWHQTCHLQSRAYGGGLGSYRME